MTVMLEPVLLPVETSPGQEAPQTVLIRALDAPRLARLGEFVSRLRPEDVRLRFAAPRRLDSDEAIAAAFGCGDGESEMIWALAGDGAIAGIASLALAAASRLELSLVVRPDQRHRGTGLRLVAAAKQRARERRIATLVGFVAWENRPMFELAQKSGFRAIGARGMLTEFEWAPGRDGG
jgi:acetyltransferase